jgi:hypothetical protein
MKLIGLSLIALFGLISLTNCVQDSAEGDKLKSEETANPSSSSSVESPCELVTVEDVISFLSIPDGIEVNMEDKMLTYPTCTFKWKDGVWKKSQVIGTQTISYDMEAKVTLVLVQDAKSSMFDRSTTVYKNPEELSGLGERAVWGDNMNQLTFLSGSTMMHVHVFASDDKSENRKHAIEIAKHALKGL